MQHYLDRRHQDNWSRGLPACRGTGRNRKHMETERMHGWVLLLVGFFFAKSQSAHVPAFAAPSAATLQPPVTLPRSGHKEQCSCPPRRRGGAGLAGSRPCGQEHRSDSSNAAEHKSG